MSISYFCLVPISDFAALAQEKKAQILNVSTSYKFCDFLKVTLTEIDYFLIEFQEKDKAKAMETILFNYPFITKPHKREIFKAGEYDPNN